jgi:tRNA A-37 threonylcarbamoyl transferase component Bud32
MAERPGGGVVENEQLPSSLRDGRYHVRGLLGSGAQAQTLEAEDTLRGRAVAIKRFSVRGARSWKDVELAEREARVLSELSHPSLPAYFEHFEEDGALYLVMEKVEGRTLAELRQSRSLDQAQIVRFLREAGATLRYLHGRAPPIIHRDIKPQNVIQRPDGSFALVDFGSVRDQLRPEGGSTVVGTFGYMAPEQFQGRALPVTDVYGVGATAIACLAGQDPETLPHKGLALDVQAALRGRADRGLIDLLSRLVEPDPDRRPQDLERAMREASRGDARSSAPAERTPPKDARAEERRLRKELREARRLRKRERKAKRRERRRGPSRREHWRGPVAGLVLLAVMIALLVARVATFALFRLALPAVLGVLAALFGKSLERAAQRSAQIGRQGEEALVRALSQLRTAQPDETQSEEQPRLRVDPLSEADSDEDSDDASSERRAARHRS